MELNYAGRRQGEAVSKQVGAKPHDAKVRYVPMP
jgi:hypothetical protein